MHVIECNGAGGPDVLRIAERPMPQPQADEVLIKVAAAGMNRADILQRQGNYPPPDDAPKDIPGMEVAGEIVAAGAKASRWKIGDKICALISGGGYAEYAVAPEGQCLPVPVGLFLDRGCRPARMHRDRLGQFIRNRRLAAGPHGPGAWRQQRDRHHGHSDGQGAWREKFSSPPAADEKCAACRKTRRRSCDQLQKEDFVAVIERITKKHGVDVVLDMVGGDYVARNLSVLAAEGRHVSIAVQGGKNATVDLWRIMRERLVLTGSTLRHRARPEKARLAAVNRRKMSGHGSMREKLNH